MSIQNIKKLGEMELKLIFALEKRKDNLFSVAYAKSILGTSNASVWNVLKRLKKKNRVIRLQRGAYLFAPMRSGEEGLWTEDAFRIVPELVRGNYYIGFISAMNYWGMTEQLPIIVYVALTRQKHSLEAVQAKYVFIKKRSLSDFVPISFGSAMINISSVEQTILDGLSFPKYCTGLEGVAKAIWFTRKKIDWEKLILLAKKDKSIVRRRLGYTLVLLGLKKQAKELEFGYKGFAWFDPTAQKTNFKYCKKWGMKINIEGLKMLEFQKGY